MASLWISPATCSSPEVTQRCWPNGPSSVPERQAREAGCWTCAPELAAWALASAILCQCRRDLRGKSPQRCNTCKQRTWHRCAGKGSGCAAILARAYAPKRAADHLQPAVPDRGRDAGLMPETAHEPAMALDGERMGWIFTAPLPPTTVILSAPVGGWCLRLAVPSGGCDGDMPPKRLAASAGKEGLRRQRPCGVRPTGEINLIFNVLQLKCGNAKKILKDDQQNGCNSCRDWL